MPILDRFNAVPGVAPGTGYSHAVTVSGRLAFIAGQVAMDEQGNLVGPGDLATQTRQALQNLDKVLRSLGADWSHVVRFNWYVVAGAADLQAIRSARNELLQPVLGDKLNPASTLIHVAGLFRPEFLIEVDAVVALPE
jgi:enamine deaminase RidA (YjgF/YER057c/UK114 family)